MRLDQVPITTFAKGGGGCFLANTMIRTGEHAQVPIQDIQVGDSVVSFNEKTQDTEPATVGRIDVLERDHYFVINDDVKATAEHPFYVHVNGVRIIKKVGQLRGGDMLETFTGLKEVQSIVLVSDKVTVYNLINVEPNNNYFANNYLVHNKGSVGGGGRASSSGARSTTSKSSSSSSTPSKPAAPKVGTSTAKPGSAIKTATGTTVVSSTKKPSNTKYTSSKGVVGDNGYTPRFRDGYSAPAGSVVYYRDHSALDYLPWIYLFSQDSSPAPQYQTATVVQPDGKEVQTKPVAEGVDGLAILNWFILIAIIAAIIGGIVYWVNKKTSKPKPTSKFNGYYA